MGIYVQLDADGNVVSVVESDKKVQGANIIDVSTVAVVGGFEGKKYDSNTGTFIDAKAADVRPLAEVLLYVPGDKDKTLKTTWMTGEPIAIEVSIKDAQGQIVTAFNGSFGIPILGFDPLQQRFGAPVRCLKLDFVDGVATRDFAGFAQSGFYGVDSRVSTMAKVAQPLIVTVWE